MRHLSFSRAGRLLGLGIGLAACGGGDGGNGGVTPPPPPPTVATVEVAPTTATLLAPATQQLTAVAKDATGATLARTFTWTSSSAAVATVSASGLVTSVAAGTATITAAVDGKQGTATITVVANSDGPIVARGALGAAGGTIGTDDIAVTVPAGALATTATLELVRDTVRPNAYGANAASATYLVDGLPSDRTVPLRVRLKRTVALSGAAAIGVIRPTVAMSDLDSITLGASLVAATDSAGYLVATVPLRGRPATWTTTPLPATRQLYGGARVNALASAESNPADLKAAAELTGLIDLTKVASAAGHFEVWGFGQSAAQTASATKLAQLLEQARTTILGMGYAWDHRVTWPMPAYMMKGVGWNGCYYSVAPDPYDPNLSYVAFNMDREAQGWFPGTVIHELFHFTQTGFTKSMAWPTLATTRWLGEITSTWISERHPAIALPYNHPTPLSWADSLWSGLNFAMVANSGYGKAPMAKWLADTYGDGKIKQIYTDIGNGANPIAAFLMAFPGERDVWYPQFLKAQLEGRLWATWPVSALWPQHAVDGPPTTTGLREYITPWLDGLGSRALLINRDTAQFGPEFSLQLALDTASAKLGTLTAFRYVRGAPAFTYVGTGDTVRFPPAAVRSTDDLLVLATNTDIRAPYDTRKRLTYGVDMRVPEGDVLLTQATNLSSNSIRFSCTQPGDSVSMEPLANTTQIFSMFGNAGRWRKTAESPTPPYATYTWAVYPSIADSVAMFGLQLESTMEVGRADTVRVRGRFRWGETPALRSGGLWGFGSGGNTFPWWAVAIVAVALPLAVRIRRPRRALPLLAAGLVLLVAGCGVGMISIAMDESFEFVFVKPRLVNNVPNAKALLAELRNGSGTTTLTHYRMEHWVKFTNTEGKTDSVKSVCTGSGTARYSVTGAIYTDSVRPPETVRVSPDARLKAWGQAVGVDLTNVSPAVKARLR